MISSSVSLGPIYASQKDSLIGARLEMRTVGGPATQLDDEANSEIADGRKCGGQLPSPPYFRRRFANFQRQRAPAGPPISVFCANAPRTWVSPKRKEKVIGLSRGDTGSLAGGQIVQAVFGIYGFLGPVVRGLGARMVRSVDEI